MDTQEQAHIKTVNEINSADVQYIHKYLSLRQTLESMPDSETQNGSREPYFKTDRLVEGNRE